MAGLSSDVEGWIYSMQVRIMVLAYAASGNMDLPTPSERDPFLVAKINALLTFYLISRIHRARML